MPPPVIGHAPELLQPLMVNVTKRNADLGIENVEWHSFGNLVFYVNFNSSKKSGMQKNLQLIKKYCIEETAKNGVEIPSAQGSEKFTLEIKEKKEPYQIPEETILQQYVKYNKKLYPIYGATILVEKITETRLMVSSRIVPPCTMTVLEAPSKRSWFAHGTPYLMLKVEHLADGMSEYVISFQKTIVDSLDKKEVAVDYNGKRVPPYKCNHGDHNH